MAELYQKYLFSWKDINELGDLERLQIVLDHLPDERLMTALEELRKNGRNDFPLRPMWNALLAGIVFQHCSIESLIRELKRNGQLRYICGFNPLNGLRAVPTSMAFSRFLVKLMSHQELVEEMFSSMVTSLTELLPDFGHALAFDGKAIRSLSNGKKPSSSRTSAENDLVDRRKEADASWGVKIYKGQRRDGTLWEKTKSWFGFKIHLIVDAKYELPVAYDLRAASVGEQSVMKELFDLLAVKQPELLKKTEFAMGDKGYDSQPMISKLWDDHGIKPVIDIKATWREKETKLLQIKPLENVTYDQNGAVYCHCPVSGDRTRMAFNGFEQPRNSLKYKCPALQYGFECKGAGSCPAITGLRIPLREDPRVFTPIARSTPKWKRLYNQRTSVERVNSRLDVSFGFERHFIRGLQKMQMRCGIALCVMLALALGRARQNNPVLMRSLVRVA